MPVASVAYADQLDSKVAELEASGQQIIQIVPRGEGWVIVYRKGPGRPPAAKETRVYGKGTPHETRSFGA